MSWQDRARELFERTGRRYYHDARECAKEIYPCCLHAPSEHHMQDWQLNWRVDRGMMERICVHGVGHPDPDHMAREIRLHGDDADDGIRGCDGCCARPT